MEVDFLTFKKTRRLERILNAIKLEGRFERVEHDSRGSSTVIYLTQSDDQGSYVLKIPHGKKPKDECEMSYNIFNSVRECTHLIRLFGSQPPQYDGNPCILMEGAETSIEEYLNDHEGPIGESEALSIIEQIAMGVSQIHRKNYRHRDIKPANLLAVKDETSTGKLIWKVSDYGTASQSDYTTSEYTGERFQSYEVRIDLKARISAGGKRTKHFDIPNDIFGVGAILYMLLNPDHKTALEEWEEREEELAYVNFVMKQISELKVSAKAKHLVTGLMGWNPAYDVPTGITADQYRYSSVDDFLEDLRTKPSKFRQGKTPPRRAAQSPQASPGFDEYAAVADQFGKAVRNASRHRKAHYGTLDLDYIDTMVTLHDHFLKLYNQEEVKRDARHEDIAIKAEELWTKVVSHDMKILGDKTSAIQDMDDNKELGQYLTIAMQILFTWGPPFTFQDRRGHRGKARYPLAEQRSNIHAFYQAILLPEQYTMLKRHISELNTP